MTREEAINQLKDFIILHQGQHGWDVSTLNALNMAIKALEHHPCEDCISRQAVLREFTCLSDDAFVINRKIQEIVKKLPSVEPEKCGDCISRRVIIGKCEDTIEATSDSGEMNTGFIMALDFIAGYAKHLPSVEPERKTGKWEDCSNGWMCSECKHDVTYTTKYCPNCGTKMEVNENG